MKGKISSTADQSLANARTERAKFISLRLKLLVGFTVVYSVVFATAYAWFYRFSSDRAMQRIQKDLVVTLEGAIQGIDPEEFQLLAVVEVPQGQTLPTEHSLYQEHQAWLQTVHQIEPRANPYTFVAGHKPYEILFIGDFLRQVQPTSSTSFREPYIADPAKTRLYQGLSHLAITLTPYRDQWGSWVSAYGPIKDKHGTVVGGVGIDFRADHVLEVQQGVRQHVAIAFSITYASLFVLVYIISGIVTRPIIRLAVATERVSEETYDQTLLLFRSQYFQDEISSLAETFERMVEKIRKREVMLQESNQLLEAKVERRTQELQTKNFQLFTANAELERATRLKDEFLATMSHELRTPLNAILGLTEGLQTHVFGEVTDRQMSALQTIEQSGYHLLELINDILDIAKMESGHLQLQCQNTLVAPLCQASLAFIQQQAQAKHIQVETKLPSNLPELWVDERRIRQVLINLLSNAVKFTPEGGRITLEVLLLPHSKAGTEAKKFLQIAITDTGIGIAPDHIPLLFQPFIQIDSSLNRKYEGTGLGLVLVKRIVELHGGKVGLRSKVGVGSCFMIDLPYIDTVSSPVKSTISPSTVTSLEEPKHAAIPLILLAEDNPDNVATLSSYLMAKGYQVLPAKNGEEAIALIQSNQPDLILMDIQMPKMDGLEAIRAIRHELNLTSLPIIAITALAMEKDRDRCLTAGANVSLTKPIKLKHLNELITTLLEHSDFAKAAQPQSGRSMTRPTAN